MSAYGRIAVKIAHRIGDTQSRTVTIRNACRAIRDRPGPTSASAAARVPVSTVVARHASASWKLFHTKITIGTIEIVSSTTAIAEP